jgi:hypothetical protein
MAETDESTPDREDDPDYISEDGEVGASVDLLGMRSPGWLGRPGPVFVPAESTPLAKGEDKGALPRYALWSMKYLRGSHLFGQSEGDIQEIFGAGHGTVYVMDDGRKHCLISRKVGSGTDGSVYCLVARIPRSAYEQLVDGTRPEDAFTSAGTFSLCSVFDAEDAVSNVTVVASYRTTSEVPSEYLPPHAPIVFTESDEP